MAETTKRASEAADVTFMTAMMDLQRAGLGPLAWMSADWFERFNAMGAEVAQFVADRLKEDVRTQHQILHCRNAEELREIQVAFMQKAIDQYTAETGKLVEMSQDLFREPGKNGGQ